MQKRNLIHKLNTKILCVLILFVLIYITAGFVPQTLNISYGATYTYTKNSNNLPSDFEQKYPGYVTLVQALVASHPNWTFKLYETGLSWEATINSEYQNHADSIKNVVPNSYSNAWICSICGREEQDTGRWYCASRQAIEHVMDPRNSLNDANLFQYLQLSNDSSITKDQVAQMASKISYLNNQSIIDAIYEVANDPEYNINPFYIIGKILQEQGSGASALCSGPGYKGQYVGYYNLFNVGASGKGEEAVILNGLAYAKSQGWDTPKKSIMGGIGLVKRYIKRGQDTLYYQKFNVTYKPYYVNQYAQNLFDAQSIGSILKGYYKDAGLLESSFTFVIPLYTGMPSTACKSPSISGDETGELAYINANGGLKLKDAPNGNSIAIISEGTQVLITERATSKVGGYYWDKVSTPRGTGYMAREASDGSKTYLVVIGSNKNDNIAEPDENNIITSEPGTTVNTIKKKYSNAVIVDKNGNEITGDTLVGTGAKVKIDGVEKYTIVKLGDPSGDGRITPSDYVKIKNKIMGTTTMDAITEKAADVNRDGKITPADYVKVKNHIMQASKITL